MSPSHCSARSLLLLSQLTYKRAATLFLLDKRSRGEGDSSHQSNADVKNEWSYTSPPPICLHVVHSTNSIFTHLNSYGSKANPIPVPTAAAALSSFLRSNTHFTGCLHV